MIIFPQPSMINSGSNDLYTGGESKEISMKIKTDCVHFSLQAIEVFM